MAVISNLQSSMIAPAAREWLQTTRNGRVLHVFERVCNLVNERGEVLSLVTRPAGLGPFAMVVEGVAHPAGFLQWVDGASAVRAEGEQLVAGRLVVETAGASRWPARPDWAGIQARAARLAAGVPLVRALLVAEGPAGSLAGLVEGDLPNRPTIEAERASLDALLRSIGNGAEQLVEGIKNLDVGLVQTAAQALAGLGGGLTPAGDDLLLGMMVALWGTQPEAVARPLAEAMARAAGPRTTRLSAAYLTAAGRGEVAWLWHELLQAMVAAEEEGVKAAVRAILSMGHTSGADMLAGFCLGALVRAGNIRYS